MSKVEGSSGTSGNLLDTMVHFKTILQALEKNAQRSFTVTTMTPRPQNTVEIFRHISRPAAVTSILAKTQSIPKKIQASRSESPEPLPTRVKITSSVLAESPTPAPVAPPPMVIVPAPVAPPPMVAPSPPNKRKGMDPLRLAIEIRDPMYAIATQQVRQSIECEEARKIEAQIDELYKSESGRSRGWTKTALEAYLLPRAAAGLAVSAKDTFDWSLLAQDKKVAAVLDFICLAKNIRLAVWSETDKELTVWPAADRSKSLDGNPIPLFHVTSDGIFKGSGPLELPTDWSLRAPPSFEHSLEKLTIAELDNVAAGLGLTGLTGKKGERVRIIGAARVRQRLAAS